MLSDRRPLPEEGPPYGKYYVERTGTAVNLLEALKRNKEDIASFIRSIPEDKGDFQYADGKWSTKSVIAHIIDTERMFQYRALRLSRKDPQSIEGFDEDWYAAEANTDNRSFEDLAAEFEAVRDAGIQLFSYMSDSMADYKGTANNMPLTARFAGWILVGHAVHHVGIIKERYLVEVEE